MRNTKNTCDICQHRGFDSARGVICKLTEDKPPLSNTCNSFSREEAIAKDRDWKQKLRDQEQRSINVKRAIIVGLLLGFIIFVVLVLMAIGEGIGAGLGNAFRNY